MRMRYTHVYQPNKQRRIVNCASDALSSMIFLLRREWRRNVNQILFARSEQLDVRFLGGDTHTGGHGANYGEEENACENACVCSRVPFICYFCIRQFIFMFSRICTWRRANIYIPARPYTVHCHCLLKYFNCKSLKFIVLICKLDVTS